MKASNLSATQPIGFVILLVLIGIAGRLLPHPMNVTPLGGLALWSGMRLERKTSLLVVLATLLVTDLFLGFHEGTWVVWSSILLITFLASLIKKTTFLKVAGMTLAGSGLFFLITNLTFLHAYSLYPKTLEGMLASYAAALPFFRNSLLGDITYTAAFFGLEYVVFVVTQKRLTPKTITN